MFVRWCAAMKDDRPACPMCGDGLEGHEPDYESLFAEMSFTSDIIGYSVCSDACLRAAEVAIRLEGHRYAPPMRVHQKAHR